MKEEKELSHRQRQRARKRLLKKQNLNKKLNKLEKTKGKKEIEDILTKNVSFLLFFSIIKSYIDCFRPQSSNFINIFGRS